MTPNAARERLTKECRARRDTHLYPWPRLTAQQSIFVVLYCPLMHDRHAADILRASLVVPGQSVLACGGRRVFQYRLSPAELAVYGADPHPSECAGLNLSWTSSPSDVFNGRLITLHADDLAALRRRHAGYDLQPVTCINWNGEGDAVQAFALSCPDGIRGCVDRSIRPCRPYYTLARASAAAVSPAFLEFFLDTTYLNDGSTVREWEQAHGYEFRPGDDVRYVRGR